MNIEVTGAVAAALAACCAVGAALDWRQHAPTRRHPDLASLEASGWRFPLWQWELARVAALVTAAAVARAVDAPVAALAIGGAVLPSATVRWRAATVLAASRPAVTRLLRTTEATLRAGGGLPEALRRATQTCGDPLARRPFARALHAFDLGTSLDEALAAAARDEPDRRTRLALGALAIGVTSRLSAERASALACSVADRLSFDERLEGEIRARTNGLRSQVLLLAAVVPAIAVYLAATVPSLAETLASPIGRTVLVPAGIALELVGLIASKRAVDAALR